MFFTGMNQDTAANVYDFPAREYAGAQGRWPSPDPAGLAAVDPTLSATPPGWYFQQTQGERTTIRT